jgi:hypothetical protein
VKVNSVTFISEFNITTSPLRSLNTKLETMNTITLLTHNQISRTCLEVGYTKGKIVANKECIFYGQELKRNPAIEELFTIEIVNNKACVLLNGSTYDTEVGRFSRDLEYIYYNQIVYAMIDCKIGVYELEIKCSLK